MVSSDNIFLQRIKKKNEVPSEGIETENKEKPSNIFRERIKKSAQKSTQKEPEESLGKKVVRGIAQPMLGALSKLTYPANILQMAGQGEAIGEFEELQERLPELMKKFPDAPWENFKGLDKEKYMKAVEEAGAIFPTQQNLEAYIEEKTGTPLTAKSTIDKILRLGATGAAFKSGNAVEKTKAAVAVPITKEYLVNLGVPEQAAELAALAIGTHNIEKPSDFTKFGGKPNAKEIESGLVGEGKLPKSTFETAEKALQEIKPITEGKPLGIEAKIFTPGEGKSLAGRVQKEPALGNAITRESFETSAQGGRTTSNLVKETAKEARKPVEAAYTDAKEITEGHSDVYPELAAENNLLIKELESLEKRNAGQEAVYQQALAIERMIGTPEALIEQNAAKLMAQSDSMSQMGNYDLPYVGYKGKIKALVRATNNAVIESLKKSGKDFAKVQKADKMYAQWADRFLGDEISPFMSKKILNPESLYNTVVENPGSYRAVKDAIGSRKNPVIEKIDRDIVETRMSKYYKDSAKVGTEEYVSDLKNLNELIGKEKTAEVDSLLRSRAKTREAKFKSEQIIKEAPKKNKPSTETKLDALAKKVSEHSKLKPEDILDKLNNRSGIKQLRKDLNHNSFDTLTKQKMRSILREGNIEKKFKGDDLYKILNKEKNFEIFSEIIGEEATEVAREAAKSAGKRQIAAESVKDLAKKKLLLKFLGIVVNVL